MPANTTTLETIGVNDTDTVRVVDQGGYITVQLWRGQRHVSNNGGFSYHRPDEREQALRNAHGQAAQWARGLIFDARVLGGGRSALGNGTRARGGWTSRTTTTYATSEPEAMRNVARYSARAMRGYFPVSARRLDDSRAIPEVLARARAAQPSAAYFEVHLHRSGRKCASCAQKGARS